MNELSLFTGAGGGLLGTKLLGFNNIGYVEFNDYCQRIIQQRIKDGILDEAPIFGDIRTFISEGYAGSYQGMADIVTAGFPCPAFSVAGKRLGEHDERNMWPETLECIRIIKPKYAYLENVPGLLSSGCSNDAGWKESESLDDWANRFVGYFGTILRDLAESGFDVRWRVLSAAEMGAPHKRDRVWIVAHNNGNKLRNKQIRQQRSSTQTEPANDGEKQFMGNTKYIG